MISLVILGSTGSIGTQTLQVVKAYPDRFRVVGLSCDRNLDGLTEQIQVFHPEMVACTAREDAQRLQNRFPTLKVLAGEEGFIQLACHDEASTVVSAMAGKAGWKATYMAAKEGKRVALANKESLVLAGPLLHPLKDQLIPIDSEHAALFQLLDKVDRAAVESLWLSASGGPFLHRPLETFETITPEEALQHPTWQMGAKITIDSATMMNKAQEVIEAHYLFDFPPGAIQVVIHPQSLVHGLIALKDGNILAHLGFHDMTIPIQYALSYPERWASKASSLKIPFLPDLTFAPVDPERFPGLRLGYDALKGGESLATVLGVANEIGVHAFLSRQLSFPAITAFTQRVMEAHDPLPLRSIEDVEGVILWAERKSKELLNLWSS